MPAPMVAPEHATETKVTEVCGSASSRANAALAGPERGDRWQRLSCSVPQSAGTKFSKEGRAPVLLPSRDDGPMADVFHVTDPGTTGLPSPDAIESPIDTTT